MNKVYSQTFSGFKKVFSLGRKCSYCGNILSGGQYIYTRGSRAGVKRRELNVCSGCFDALKRGRAV